MAGRAGKRDEKAEEAEEGLAAELAQGDKSLQAAELACVFKGREAICFHSSDGNRNRGCSCRAS